MAKDKKYENYESYAEWDPCKPLPAIAVKKKKFDLGSKKDRLLISERN